MAGMNIFDLVVIGIIVVSALVGLARGLTKEILSIGGWVGAALAAYVAYPYVKPFARAHIDSTLIADIAAAVGFLSSDEARFITGQVVGVNGGSVL